MGETESMIIDSHCHAWHTWPYQPPVPDPESRARVEQLLFEMDQSGVDKATIVCARIDHNPDNNDYVAEQVARLPDRLYQIADVDCFWWPTYHTPGAHQRLIETAEKYPIVGFTHYVSHEDDGSWLATDDGMGFFRAAADRNLIASISCSPHHHEALRKVAAAFPQLVILVHHLGAPRADEGPPFTMLNEILKSAELPNMHIKVSGYYYAAQAKHDYPYFETHWIVRQIYSRFGPYRLCWGSDYPVSRKFMTYQQCVEAFRQHCSFIPASDQAWIMGDTLAKLLETRAPL